MFKKKKIEKPLRVSILEITLTENMNLFYIKTKEGFLNAVGQATFFTLNKNGCETNYLIVDNLCLIYEGGIE